MCITTQSLLAFDGDLSHDAFCNFVDYCNNTINADTPLPFEIILQGYNLYVAMVKVEKSIHDSKMLLDKSLKKKKFTPIGFFDFYQCLDPEVERCLRDKQFVEYLYVVQNL
jgi:hypothetical protein